MSITNVKIMYMMSIINVKKAKRYLVKIPMNV